MHLEFDSINLDKCIEIGTTTACARIVFDGGFLTSYAEKWTGYLIYISQSSDIEFRSCMIYAEATHRGKGIYVDANSTRFRYSGRSYNIQLQDNSTSSPYAVNLLPNNQFENYLDRLGQTYTTSCTASKESASITKYIRTGNEGLRLTASSGGLSLSRMGIILNPQLLSRLKGKTITFGAWVYVPNHANFVIPNYPTDTNLLPGVLTIYDYDGGTSTSTSSNTTGLCIPGGWNFVTVTHTVQSDATQIQLFLHCLTRAGGSAVSDGTEFVVFDSLYLAEGNLLPGDILKLAPCADFTDRFDNGNWTGGVTLNWQREYTQTATLTGNVTSITNTLPQARTQCVLLINQSGSGSYTLTFPITWKFNNGSGIQPAAAIGSTSTYTLVSDGTNMHVTSVKKD